MTYYLLQTAALFLVAYFTGCWFGCFLKTQLAAGTQDEAVLDDAGLTQSEPLPRQRPVAPPLAPMPAPLPAPAPAVARSSVPALPPLAPAKPAVATPVNRPVVPSPAQRSAGSGVSAEVTAAAAAAAAATLATAASRVPAASVATASARAGGASDDLKRIKGIGPEIERKLNGAGVNRYTQIAAWTAMDVSDVNTALGQEGRVQHENWIEQAQILSRGNDTAFSRRVDRREVDSGTAETWHPTAPGEVVSQATAAVPVPVAGLPPRVLPATPPASVAPPAQAMPAQMSNAASAASAAAAAAVAAAAAIGTSRLSPAAVAAPAVAPAAVTQVAPSAPPVVRPTVAAPPLASPAAVQTVAPAIARPVDLPPSQPISMRPAPGPGNLRRFVRLAAPEGKADDLSLINGIGDKIAGELNRYGIYHFWQLAAMGQEDVDYMESRLGHKGQMRREEWPEQARELMAGKPPRAKSDRDRAGQAQPAAQPHVHTHPHTHKDILPPAQPSAQPQAQVSTAPAAAQVLPPLAPVPQTAAPAVHHRSTAAHHHPVPSDAGAMTTAAAAAAAAAVAGAAGQTRSPPPAPVQPVTPPPAPPAAAVQPPLAPPANPAASPVSQPQGSAQTAGGDAAPSSWIPRSRPGNFGSSGQRDDLKRIKGVGVVIEKKLEAMGVTTYAQIAAWKIADIEKVSNALDFKGRIEREGWVEQARILDGGGQTDFSRRMDRGDMPGGRA